MVVCMDSNPSPTQVTVMDMEVSFSVSNVAKLRVTPGGETTQCSVAATKIGGVARETSSLCCSEHIG